MYHVCPVCRKGMKINSGKMTNIVCPNCGSSWKAESPGCSPIPVVVCGFFLCFFDPGWGIPLIIGGLMWYRIRW